MKRKKTIMHILEPVLILVLTAAGVLALTFYLRPVEADGVISRTWLIRQIPEDSAEVLFLGNSHMVNGISPIDLFDGNGIAAFNYAARGSDADSLELAFSDALSLQTPKVVVIDTFNLQKSVKNSSFNLQIHYSHYFRDEAARKKYIETAFWDQWEKYVYYQFPIFYLHENWKSISKASFRTMEDIYSLAKNMGAYYMDKQTLGTADLSLDRPEQTELKWHTKVVLGDIIEKCREKGISVLLVTIPYEGGNPYHNAFTGYAKNHGCEYLDLFEYIEEIGLDGETDFVNAGHLNISGKSKLSAFLGDYLVSHYQLTDYREIPDNYYERYFNELRSREKREK